MACSAIFRDSEKYRLKSFAKCPNKDIKSTTLAKEGFFYTRKNDTIKCVHCNKEFSGWKTENDINHSCQSQVLTDGCTVLQLTNHINKKSKIVEEKPKTFKFRADKAEFKKFANLNARIASYQHWPQGLKQKPAELAKAGLFYTGKGDRTICFYCGGGLKDWDEVDIPLVEHHKWYPECEYLLLYSDELEEEQRKQSTLSKNQNESKNSDSLKTNNVEKDTTFSNSSLECKICLRNQISYVFMPCGHLVSCKECLTALSDCPMCRMKIESAVRVYL